MKLGEFIKSNYINEISVATDIDNLDSRVIFTNMDMIPVKYWEADIKTFRHKTHFKNGSIMSIELIAVVKI